MSADTPDVSVVIPAYREAAEIAATVQRLRDALSATGRSFEIVVVDDGSPDDTAAQSRSAGADQVLQLGHNLGKGAAVREGMLAATGKVRCFVDADLAYAPDQLLRVVGAVEAGADAAVGNRRLNRTGPPSGSILRRVGGRLISLLSAWLVLGEMRDSQCGLKAFESGTARWVFSRTRVDGFGFDVEVFHLLGARGAVVVDVPVSARESERSTVRVVRDGLRLLIDLLVIRYRSRRGDYGLTEVRV